MAPGNVLAACVFSAVSSAALFIYLLLCKGAGRGTDQSKGPGDSRDELFADAIPLKPPADDPLFAGPRVKGVKGRSSGLGLPIFLVILALLVGSALFAVRVAVRSQFDRVIREITSGRPPEADAANSNPGFPEFRASDLQLRPIRPERLPLDGMRRIGAPGGGGFGSRSNGRATIGIR
jgi:hypothetical protein